METQRQSKSGSPAPRSFELDSLAWWKRSGIWIVGILVIAVVVMATTPPRGCRKRAAPTEAVSNARQIGLALSEFERKYGCFPDSTSIAKVREKVPTDLNLGTKSSNDFFRQLLASGIAPNEAMFYAEIQGTHKPDNVFSGTKALEKGECGFTYFLGAAMNCDPKRPVAASPMIPGTDRFDPKPFEGKAVVLWSDASVTSVAVRKDGCAFLGTSILMDSSNPVWDGRPPVIAWPEF
jgi:hypothetical protein